MLMNKKAVIKTVFCCYNNVVLREILIIKNYLRSILMQTVSAKHHLYPN